MAIYRYFAGFYQMRIDEGAAQKYSVYLLLYMDERNTHRENRRSDNNAPGNRLMEHTRVYR